MVTRKIGAEVLKMNFNDQGELTAVGPYKRYQIGNYNGIPVYACYDYVIYKGHFITICQFDPIEAKRYVRYYAHDYKFLDYQEVLLFNSMIDQGKNPFESIALTRKLVERAKKKGYRLQCSQIPEFIAYQTVEKTSLTLEELKWLHDHIVIQKKVNDDE